MTETEKDGEGRSTRTRHAAAAAAKDDGKSSKSTDCGSTQEAAGSKRRADDAGSKTTKRSRGGASGDGDKGKGKSAAAEGGAGGAGVSKGEAPPTVMDFRVSNFSGSHNMATGLTIAEFDEIVQFLATSTPYTYRKLVIVGSEFAKYRQLHAIFKTGLTDAGGNAVNLKCTLKPKLHRRGRRQAVDLFWSRACTQCGVARCTCANTTPVRKQPLLLTLEGFDIPSTHREILDSFLGFCAEVLKMSSLKVEMPADGSPLRILFTASLPYLKGTETTLDIRKESVRENVVAALRRAGLETKGGVERARTSLTGSLVQGGAFEYYATTGTLQFKTVSLDKDILQALHDEVVHLSKDPEMTIPLPNVDVARKMFFVEEAPSQVLLQAVAVHQAAMRMTPGVGGIPSAHAKPFQITKMNKGRGKKNGPASAQAHAVAMAVDEYGTKYPQAMPVGGGFVGMTTMVAPGSGAGVGVAQPIRYAIPYNANGAGGSGKDGKSGGEGGDGASGNGGNIPFARAVPANPKGSKGSGAGANGRANGPVYAYAAGGQQKGQKGYYNVAQAQHIHMMQGNGAQATAMATPAGASNVPFASVVAVGSSTPVQSGGKGRKGGAASAVAIATPVGASGSGSGSGRGKRDTAAAQPAAEAAESSPQAEPEERPRRSTRSTAAE